MNFVSKFAETLADVPNPVCVLIIILIFILICLVIFSIVCFLGFLKGNFERYIEEQVSSILRAKYGDVVTHIDERIVKEVNARFRRIKGYKGGEKND